MRHNRKHQTLLVLAAIFFLASACGENSTSTQPGVDVSVVDDGSNDDETQTDAQEPTSPVTEPTDSDSAEAATSTPAGLDGYGTKVGDERPAVPANQSDWGPATQVDAERPGDRAEIEIGQVVSGDVTLGQVDQYDFWVYPGQTLFFDHFVGDVLCDDRGDPWMLWQLPTLDPADDKVHFNEWTSASTGCGAADIGPMTFDQGGQYTLQLSYADDCRCEGRYSFVIRDVPPPDRFEIETGVAISADTLGQGAGNIETPGAMDIYEMEVEAGDFLFFNNYPEGGCGEGDSNILMQVPTVRPDDDAAHINDWISASTGCAASDFGPFEIEESGTLQILYSYSPDHDGTGTYSFIVEKIEG